jgi:hypothetical protein
LLLLWLLFSDGGFKLSDNRLGELVRVDLAGLGKLDDSDCDELRNGDGLDARQPQSGAHLFEPWPDLRLGNYDLGEGGRHAH